jgi:hypothetical protein
VLNRSLTSPGCSCDRRGTERRGHTSTCPGTSGRMLTMQKESGVVWKTDAVTGKGPNRILGGGGGIVD